MPKFLIRRIGSYNITQEDIKWNIKKNKLLNNESIDDVKKGVILIVHKRYNILIIISTGIDSRIYLPYLVLFIISTSGVNSSLKTNL